METNTETGREEELKRGTVREQRVVVDLETGASREKTSNAVQITAIHLERIADSKNHEVLDAALTSTPPCLNHCF